MAQALVATGRVRVVVGVALQVEGRPVGEHVVAVPAVVRLGALVAAVGLLVAQQAVVLDVVGGGQLEGAPEGGAQNVGQQTDAEDGEHGAPGDEGDDRRLDDLVLQGPDRFALGGQAVLLQAPSALRGAGQLTQRELPDALAHA